VLFSAVIALYCAKSTQHAKGAACRDVWC